MLAPWSGNGGARGVPRGSHCWGVVLPPGFIQDMTWQDHQVRNRELRENRYNLLNGGMNYRATSPYFGANLHLPQQLQKGWKRVLICTRFDCFLQDTVQNEIRSLKWTQ